ncbi:MAG: hypothetical protein JSV44_12640, partial [Candidatus Zixiibacteriota bacterium]
MSDRSRSFLPVYISLSALFLLKFVPVVFPEGRCWGFNHLLFLPIWFTAVFAILTAAIAIWPFLAFSRTVGSAVLDGFVRAFFESPKRQGNRGLFIVAGAALFTLFPMPTHFLGDGYPMLANLASEAGTFYPWSEIGVVTIVQTIQSWLGPPSQSTALAAFRVVSVLSGLVTVFFFFLIAEIASQDRTVRLLVFLSSIGSGVLLLFFGYVENYPLLWAAYSGFIYFSLHYLRTGRGLIPIPLFLLLAIVMHFQAAMFVPAFIYLVFCRGKARAVYNRLKWGLWSLAIAIIIVGLAIFYRVYTSNLYVENIF